MQPKPFIVTGIGRSGTGYVATVLTKLGLNCGHEAVHGPQGPRIWHRPPWGDSSWLAMPYLDQQTPGTVLRTVVRDPRRWIGSWMASHPDNNAQVKPYTDFLQEHTGYWHDNSSLLERSVRLWVNWNRRSLLKAKPVQIEDAASWIPDLIEEVGGFRPDNSAVFRVFRNTPVTINTRRKPSKVYSWGDLENTQFGPALLTLATELGYV